MKQFSYVLTRPYALHARPIGNLMREAARFQSSVHLTHGETCVDVKEARRLICDDIGSGKMTVTIEGKDEEAAVAAIQTYFVENM